MAVRELQVLDCPGFDGVKKGLGVRANVRSRRATGVVQIEFYVNEPIIPKRRKMLSERFTCVIVHDFAPLLPTLFRRVSAVRALKVPPDDKDSDAQTQSPRLRKRAIRVWRAFVIIQFGGHTKTRTPLQADDRITFAKMHTSGANHPLFWRRCFLVIQRLRFRRARGAPVGALSERPTRHSISETPSRCSGQNQSSAFLIINT